MKTLLDPRSQTTLSSARAIRPAGPEIRLSPRLLVALAASSLLAACGPEVGDVRTDGGPDSSSTSAGSTGTMGPEWPKRITLVAPPAGNQGDGVQLADGVLVAGKGDLSLSQAMVLSIASPAPDSICEKGVFASLSDIPTEVDACPASLTGAWHQRAYLSASTVHTNEESTAIGLGLLLRNKEHTALYRVRVIGDSYGVGGPPTATLDYEPVP
jgi:hypothetical protein